jgi:hypothetical protein
MEEKVREIYEDSDSRRKAFDTKIGDKEDLKELENLIKKTKNNVKFMVYENL